MVPVVADDETICSFVDNHICWTIQLASPISISISTGNHLATRRTTLPFHNTVIVPVSNVKCLIIIHIQTDWPIELIELTAISISSGHSGAMLSPCGNGRNLWQSFCKEREASCQRETVWLSSELKRLSQMALQNYQLFSWVDFRAETFTVNSYQDLKPDSAKKIVFQHMVWGNRKYHVISQSEQSKMFF
jgi:hypothetical protein